MNGEGDFLGAFRDAQRFAVTAGGNWQFILARAAVTGFLIARPFSFFPNPLPTP